MGKVSVLSRRRMLALSALGSGIVGAVALSKLPVVKAGKAAHEVFLPHTQGGGEDPRESSKTPEITKEPTITVVPSDTPTPILVPSGSIGWHDLYFVQGDAHNHSFLSIDACRSLDLGEHCSIDQVLEPAYNSGNRFMFSTEHDQHILTPQVGSVQKGCVRDYRIYDKWDRLKEIADKANISGELVVIRSVEWTHDGMNHIIRLNTDEPYIPTYKIEGLYGWLANHPDELGIFCHPVRTTLSQYERYQKEKLGRRHSVCKGIFDDELRSGDASSNSLGVSLCGGSNDCFRDWRLVPEVVDQMCGQEGTIFQEYSNALLKGWRNGHWGYGDRHDIPGGSRTYGLLVEELTREGVMKAIRERRMFASYNTNYNQPDLETNLIISMRVDDHWMGDYWSKPYVDNDFLRLDILAHSPNTLVEELYVTYGMVGNRRANWNRIPVGSGLDGVIQYELPLPDTHGRFFCYVSAKGGTKKAWSTAVWVDR